MLDKREVHSDATTSLVSCIQDLFVNLREKRRKGLHMRDKRHPH